jgi:two-component system, sensor histidine kinase PdtaS
VRKLDEGRLRVSVRDEGVGVSEDFDPTANCGLGMRIVTGFVERLGRIDEMPAVSPGAEAVVTVPLSAPDTDKACTQNRVDH